MTDFASGNLQRLLDDVLQQSDLAWWEWNIPQNTVISNDLKVTWLGYDPADFRDVPYQAYTDLLHPDDYERTMQAMRDHLEGRAPIYQVDYRILRADGRYVWYMDRGQTIERGRDGRPIRLRGLVIDLGSELNRQVRNERLRTMVRQALASSGEKGGVVTVCAACKQLKLEEEIWVAVDSSFEKGLSGSVSHGLCSPCVQRLYPESAAV